MSHEPRATTPARPCRTSRLLSHHDQSRMLDPSWRQTERPELRPPENRFRTRPSRILPPSYASCTAPNNRWMNGQLRIPSSPATRHGAWPRCTRSFPSIVCRASRTLQCSTRLKQSSSDSKHKKHAKQCWPRLTVPNEPLCCARFGPACWVTATGSEDGLAGPSVRSLIVNPLFREILDRYSTSCVFPPHV